jgi:DNA-binding transcriptional ArsR family regulator
MSDPTWICTNNPWHDWDGLTCRWCDATRTPAEAIVSGLASRRGGTEDAAKALLDAHHAEQRREGARLLEDAACDADWTRTPDFCAGLRAGAELLLAAGEKATAEAATATPTDTNRRARLLHQIADGGRWKSGDVVRWYHTQGLTQLGAGTARRDLAALRDSGAITQHDEKGVRFYTLNTRKGGTA